MTSRTIGSSSTTSTEEPVVMPAPVSAPESSGAAVRWRGPFAPPTATDIEATVRPRTPPAQSLLESFGIVSARASRTDTTARHAREVTATIDAAPPWPQRRWRGDQCGCRGRPPAMVAYAMNGEPLSSRHGFPARVVVAGLYGYVSATKWLAEIELTTWDAIDGYRISRGWAKEGLIKTASRIDVPRSSATLHPGPPRSPAWPGRRSEASQLSTCGSTDGEWERGRLGDVASDNTWVFPAHQRIAAGAVVDRSAGTPVRSGRGRRT